MYACATHAYVHDARDMPVSDGIIGIVDSMIRLRYFPSRHVDTRVNEGKSMSGFEV